MIRSPESIGIDLEISRSLLYALPATLFIEQIKILVFALETSFPQDMSFVVIGAKGELNT